MDKEIQYVIIGNPENRRVSLFQTDLHKAIGTCAHVISYTEILKNFGILDSINTGNTCVRVESPGENFSVEQGILGLGGLEHATGLVYEHGRIYYPGVWYKGFCKLMTGIRDRCNKVQWFNHPDDIVIMFDKPRCKELLPHTIDLLPAITGTEMFYEFVRDTRRKRFFIKLKYSSSASGIAAFECNSRSGKMQILTTMEFVKMDDGYAFYNSLKIRKYETIEDITTVLDFLFKNGAFIEPWIPKATFMGYAFDLRVVAVSKKRCHSIARLSRSPMTNLHLGNSRCDTDELELTSCQWDYIDTIVADTMGYFSQSLYAGLDILIPSSDTSPYLIEVNAFGDLINDSLCNGKTTYTTEIVAINERAGTSNG
jgi:hypothetical protein